MIEFRGKRIDNKEWVYGYLYKLPLPSGEACMILTQDNNHLDNHLEPYHLAFTLWVDLFLVDPSTIGQFTGLTDKSGRKIYKGDIIKVREYENLLMKEFSDEPNRFDMFTIEEIRGELLKEYISPVVFDEGGFLITTIQGGYDMWLACLFGDMKRCSPSFDFEVIGNIHDNPSLIEEGGSNETAK